MNSIGKAEICGVYGSARGNRPRSLSGSTLGRKALTNGERGEGLVSYSETLSRKRLQHSTGTANRCIVTPERWAPWPINQSTRSKGPPDVSLSSCNRRRRRYSRSRLVEKHECDAGRRAA